MQGFHKREWFVPRARHAKPFVCGYGTHQHARVHHARNASDRSLEHANGQGTVRDVASFRVVQCYGHVDAVMQAVEVLLREAVLEFDGQFL